MAWDLEKEKSNRRNRALLSRQEEYNLRVFGNTNRTGRTPDEQTQHRLFKINL